MSALLLAVGLAAALVPGPIQPGKSVSCRMSSSSLWSDPEWKWGSATGKAHDEAARLRLQLQRPEQRENFLSDIGMMDIEDFKDSKIVLALKIQRASGFSRAAAYGLDREEQVMWRNLMDDMAACRFEGYRGDLLLAEAIIERLGLSEGKRLAAL